MTKILFLSRHKMTEEQRSDLERIYGEITIDTLDATISSADELCACCKGFDVLAAVLPFHLYVEFFAVKPESLRVIFARSKRIPTGETVINKDSGKPESRYLFVHDGWVEICGLNCKLCVL